MSNSPDHDWSLAPVVRLDSRDGRGSFRPLSRQQDGEPPLVGLQEQQDQLAANFAQHLTGLPANHVLLYGPRGCGKSSLVAWVLGQFVARGLKVVQTDSRSLEAGWQLLLSQRNAGNFVVFLDDWGFDEPSSDRFRALKSLLEGALDSLPANFLLCITANRRHLVPEPASETVLDEIHPLEASQERLALADRFGLWIRVPPPDQQQYLKQVAFWLDRLSRAAQIDPPELQAKPEIAERAIAWATARGGRSGRVARQFATALTGLRGLMQLQDGETPPLSAAQAKRIRSLKLP